MAVERWEVVFHGYVQGVGFRYNARRVATQFEVAGIVRNLSDGTVQVIAEGDAPVLVEFIREISQTTAGEVRQARIEKGQPTGEFDRFDIAF